MARAIDPRKKVLAARSALLMNHGFWAQLAMRLEIVEDTQGLTPYMATDGRRLIYNPAGIKDWTPAFMIGVVCHEIGHCMLGHPWRRGTRDHMLYNIAGDYVINPMVLAARMELPPGCLVDRRFDGMSTEHVYDLLKKDSERGKPQPGGDGPGEVWDDLGQAPRALQDEWKVAVVAAAQAELARTGQLPAGIERLVESIKNPAIDWRAAMRRWLQQTAKDDFSYRMPNRRYVAQGLYLPEIRSEAMPPVAFYWDTSGSRDDRKSRAECAAEFGAIVDELRPERVYVIYADDAIGRVDTFEKGEPVSFNPIGGGGTDFRPVFKYIEDHGLEIACLVGVTDADGRFPDTPPNFPVLWAVSGPSPVPFGERLQLG